MHPKFIDAFNASSFEGWVASTRKWEDHYIEVKTGQIDANLTEDSARPS